MKNKILIIILGVVVIAALIVLFLVPNDRQKEEKEPLSNSSAVYEPEFLSDAEKVELDIQTDLRIQALKRDSEGKVEVYRIIRNDSDIITNPAEVGPISPSRR